MEGWNWYAYAAGNPLAWVDPSGLGNAAVLDAYQTGLAFLGMIPVVGVIPNVINAGISMHRGNYGDAALHMLSAGFSAAGGGAIGLAATSGRTMATTARTVRAADSLTGAGSAAIRGGV